jgi:secreted trypsin-like serine protease
MRVALPIGLGLLLGAAALRAEPVWLDVAVENEARVSVHGKTTRVVKGSSRVSASEIGEESSMCQPFGRRGASDASATVDIVSRRPDSIGLSLSSTARAAGGHYRTCGACAANLCVGIFGNDTQSRADALARASIAIQFDRQYRPINYLLKVGTSGAKGLSLLLSGPQGVTRELSAGSNDGLLIEGRPGATYYLTAVLRNTAENAGGCCKQEESAQARVDVQLLRAPVQYSNDRLGTYIAGGIQTTAFPYVGALLLSGRPHCTGTLVGATTVLTAAHCLFGYRERWNDLTFVLGSNYQAPTAGPFSVIDAAYPEGIPAGYRYNDRSLEDDIGLVYLRDSPGAQAAPIHRGTPVWDDVVRTARSLHFVGFGYNLADGEKFGAGIKREASWPVSSVGNRTMRFYVPGKNTCQGDSGGPSLLESDDGAALLVAGVTSSGDDSCQLGGINTRVDAYVPWLDGRIR